MLPSFLLVANKIGCKLYFSCFFFCHAPLDRTRTGFFSSIEANKATVFFKLCLYFFDVDIDKREEERDYLILTANTPTTTTTNLTHKNHYFRLRKIGRRADEKPGNKTATKM
jgi:hypothetical protein